MDRVFEKSQPASPNSARLKRMLLGKQKRPQQEEPRYFPYGGGGDNVDDLASQFNSYEPEELMVDTRVPLEETSLSVLKRNARRILVKGSKYDVPENLVPPNSRNSSFDPPCRMAMPEPAKEPAAAPRLPTPSIDGFALPPMPVTMAHAVDSVRSIARATVVLRPLDTLADLGGDASVRVAVAAAELWLLMLALNVAAQATQLLCAPAVWLFKLCFYLVK